MHDPISFRLSDLKAPVLGLGLALGLMPSAAMAGPTPGEAQIAIVTPLSFVNYENLDFGRIIPANVAGTVAISTNNVRTATNGIVLVGNDFQVARFAGMGAQNQRVRIQIAPETISLTGPGPAMTVNNFVIGPAPTLQQLGSSSNYRIAAANGIFTFSVGGQLNVGASQPAGTYSGTFTATLDYQ
ncbi:DUF4402 domain-containing protein [Sphingorhabdus sp.]|uniref:DUF4402 domain-containing protein n=1 Tax=Sphingorhabdus sp. TaxID=1902408 RepID=UPI003919F936